MFKGRDAERLRVDIVIQRVKGIPSEVEDNVFIAWRKSRKIAGETPRVHVKGGSARFDHVVTFKTRFRPVPPETVTAQSAPFEAKKLTFVLRERAGRASVTIGSASVNLAEHVRADFQEVTVLMDAKHYASVPMSLDILIRAAPPDDVGAILIPRMADDAQDVEDSAEPDVPFITAQEGDLPEPAWEQRRAEYERELLRRNEEIQRLRALQGTDGTLTTWKTKHAVLQRRLHALREEWKTQASAREAEVETLRREVAMFRRAAEDAEERASEAEQAAAARDRELKQHVLTGRSRDLEYMAAMDMRTRQIETLEKGMKEMSTTLTTLQDELQTVDRRASMEWKGGVCGTKPLVGVLDSLITTHVWPSRWQPPFVPFVTTLLVIVTLCVLLRFRQILVSALWTSE